MIYLKTKEEIELLRVSNQIVSRTLALVGQHIHPGVTTKELDTIAEDYILSQGAVPNFKGYGGFPATLCMSVNEQIVHGIPSGYALQEGDILSVDCGAFINGFHGDSAYTFAVGGVDTLAPRVRELLEVTKEALYRGVAQAIVGNRIGDISHAVQECAQKNGMTIVREMVGHGLGRNLHEDPQIPNFGKRGSGSMLKAGMVLCIEPMINLGTRNVIFEKDGWTVRTADRKPSAHFEFAVAITEDGPDVLTTFEYIEKGLPIT